MSSSSDSPLPAVTTIDDIIREVAELPDRTSPDDWPDAMLVTADELRKILAARLPAVTTPQETLVARIVGLTRHVTKIKVIREINGIAKEVSELLAAPVCAPHPQEAETLQPPDAQGRLLLNAYGRQCYDLGYQAGHSTPEPAAPQGACEWTLHDEVCDYGPYVAIVKRADELQGPAGGAPSDAVEKSLESTGTLTPADAPSTTPQETLTDWDVAVITTALAVYDKINDAQYRMLHQKLTALAAPVRAPHPQEEK